MKADRWFYSATGALFLLLSLAGFHSFVTSGSGFEGRKIDPGIFSVVAVHGAAIAAWFLLFFLQALLIGARKRSLHMTMGWSALAIAPTIAVTGSLVAIRSVQHAPAQFHFFGMLYSRFLLVMLVEIWAFTFFVALGLLLRKKPKIHRSMMVLASLCLLGGATGRIPFLRSIFGVTGFTGLFGPIVLIGALLFFIRLAQTRKFDRGYAAGFAGMILAFASAEFLAMTDAWARMATIVLKI